MGGWGVGVGVEVCRGEAEGGDGGARVEGVERKEVVVGWVSGRGEIVERVGLSKGLRCGSRACRDATAIHSTAGGKLQSVRGFLFRRAS